MAKNKKRIRRIELEKFRGATSVTGIDFDTSKPLVIIFGENGCGKSTIGNAIDFVCNKSKGSLQYLSSTDHSHFVSIGNDPGDLRIRLFQGDLSWEGSQGGRKFNVTPPDDIPNASILRRSELLRLVEASPATRFETIRKFIDFEAVEKSEQKLRDAERNSKRTVETNAGLHAQAQGSLNSLWENDGSTGESADIWATTKLTRDLTQARVFVVSLQTAVKSIESFELLWERLTVAIRAVVDAETDLADTKKQIAEGRPDAQGSEITLVDMLNRVKAVISEPYSSNECPACQSPFDLGTLRKEVQERIDSLRSAEHLGKTLELKTETVRSKTALYEDTRKRLASSINTVNETLVPIFESVDFEGIPDQLNAVVDGIEAESNQQFSRLAVIFATIKPVINAKLDVLSRDVTLYDSIKSAVDLVERTKSDVESEIAISQGLEKALDIVRRTRLALTQEILDAVFDDFRGYWEAIHPDEPIKPTKLSLSETTKGSLNQLGSFGEHKDIAPQAYFSESHLDTLGFCYWLAIAKYSSSGDTILVLDDVFTSVDSPHIARVMNLLNSVADSFNQIIVTTHQRRWHDKYKYGTGSKDKAHVLELDQWDKELGIVVYPSTMEVEKLRNLIKSAPLDRQAVCSKAGVLLEQVLDELTKHYRCRMPRGIRAEYTLNDYVSATKELFKKLKIQKELIEPQPEEVGGIENSDVSAKKIEEITLEAVYADLVSFVTVRNLLGAHFNFKAEDYSDAEALELAEMVHKCASDLLCDSCRGLALKEDKNTGAWSCECKKMQMYPKSL